MPSIYDIKPRFQALLRPLTGALAKAGVTANSVTLFALALSIAAGAVVFAFPGHERVLLVLPGVLLARMALNAIDGMLAREHGMKSNLGAVLNEVGDVVSDAALYLPFAVVPGFSPYLVVPLVVLAIISETTGIVGVQIGASRRYDGPLGKSDRAFAFGVLALLVGCGVPAAPWVDWVLGVMVAALVLTIFHRAHRALGELR